MGMLRVLLTGLLDSLAPPRCPACDLSYISGQGEAGFCDACAPLVEPVPAAFRPPAPDGAAVLYQGPMADAIRHFKYASRSELARDLAPYLVEAALGHAGTVDAVVPMPLHPAKLRARGWNPSTLLAWPVARALGVPLRDHWLRRVRPTVVQAGLSRAQRVRNVRGAFAAKEVPPARVLLIDDVRTTSATLDEAARSLTARGHHVYTLALAWAEHDARALGADAHTERAPPRAAV